MANSKMRKSFFVYTLMRLTKNWLRYSLLLAVASLPVLHLKNARCPSQARLGSKVKASWCVNYPISPH